MNLNLKIKIKRQEGDFWLYAHLIKGNEAYGKSRIDATAQVKDLDFKKEAQI